MYLELKHLTIGYSAPVVSSIDAALHDGDFICLLGRNGSGKSTLLKTIARLEKPIGGDLISDISETSIGLVLTSFPELNNSTIFDLVSFGRIPHQGLLATLRDDDITAINKAIRLVGIETLKNRSINSLSDGEKQKAMIARAIAQGTELLLLDEPSAFLDYPSKIELMKLLQNLAHEEGKCILLSTHDVEMAKQFADSLWHIQQGNLTVISPKSFKQEDM